MKMLLCAVLDHVANVHMSPFPAANVGAARRSFGDAIANPQSPFYSHPGDYKLIQVGTWDDQKGEVEQNEDGNYVLANGSDYAVAPTIQQINKG